MLKHIPYLCTVSFSKYDYSYICLCLGLERITITHPNKLVNISKKFYRQKLLFSYLSIYRFHDKKLSVFYLLSTYNIHAKLCKESHLDTRNLRIYFGNFWDQSKFGQTDVMARILEQKLVNILFLFLQTTFTQNFAYRVTTIPETLGFILGTFRDRPKNQQMLIYRFRDKNLSIFYFHLCA